MTFTLPRYTAPDFTSPLLAHAPMARTAPAPRDGVAPEGYHAMSIFPTYFHVDGKWALAAQSRMDCVAVLRAHAKIDVVEFRRLRAGDAVFLGRTERGEDGIYVHAQGFDQPAQTAAETFAFRQGRSRETAYSCDYDALSQLLQYERAHGRIVWVLGPAASFDAGARTAMSALIANGYAHALLAGNALATHDLEGGWLGTALGQDIYTQKAHINGHYHHLDVLNAVRNAGSIPAFLQQYGVRDGILHACVQRGIPYVLAGSIRDDGPLPEVVSDVYQAQDRMRAQIATATTVICVATQLHSIAVGNMTPGFRVVDGAVRPTYFYCVDASEFAVNKLRDRGSLCVTTLITNAQDFLTRLAHSLSL